MKCRLLVATSFLPGLISFPLFARVPQIEVLKEHSALPRSVFATNSINQIAESLVFRKHRMQEKNSLSRLDYSKHTEIYIAFNSAHAKSIIRDKEFLNAHQTTQGATFHDDLKLRAKLEDELIGLKLGSFHKLRPKYAYLQPTGLKDYPETTFNPNYGNIFAKVTDRLKKRSTFTIGDSMDEGRETVHTFHFKDKINLSHPFNKIPYWEAQIWGELKLEDIDFFLVNCPEFPKASREDIESLLSSGKKVFFCSMDEHRQNMKPSREVNLKDLKGALFLSNTDRTPPSISELSSSKKIKTLQVSFYVTDDSGINYCLVKAYHYGKELLDDEISIRKTDVKSKRCQFEIRNPVYPVELKIYVKDWYTNQATASKVIK